MGVKLGLSMMGGTWAEDVLEQGAEDNTVTQDGGSTKRINCIMSRDPIF
jgi:hypothetical protein